MNFGQERYSWMEQDPYTGDKMPFYMTYPMQNTLFEETEYEKDCRRMQELYPRDARQIQSLVDRECDRMEYEGSMMYDRYPDRLMLEMLCRKIYRGLRVQRIWRHCGRPSAIMKQRIAVSCLLIITRENGK